MIESKRKVAVEAIGEDTPGEALLTEMDNDTLLAFVKLDLSQTTSD